MKKTSHLYRITATGLVAAAIAAAAMTAGPAALAAPSHPDHPAGGLAPAAGPVSWSVIPASATAPQTRANFSYTSIKPGAKIYDHVAVINRSRESVAFTVYATDASGTTAADALTFLPAAKKPVDIGSWVTLQRHIARLSVIIPARKGVIEPFTIAVPRHATPGDHTGGMVASVGFQRTNAVGQVVTVDERVVVPILLRVSGPLHAGLKVESISASYTGTLSPFGDGSATVAFTVHNAGNVRLAGRQIVSVTGPFGVRAAIRPARLPVVLPGDSIRLTAHAAGLFPAGPLSAHVTVSPANPADAPPLTVPVALASGTASLFAVPWSLILLAVLVAGAGFGGWQAWRWRRRTLRSQLQAVADHARRETERRMLAESAQPAAQPQGQA